MAQSTEIPAAPVNPIANAPVKSPRRRRRRSNKKKSPPTPRNDCEEAFAAAQNGDVDHLRSLLESKATSKRRWVDMTDERGRTLLHFAAHGGHTSVVRLLLAHGANPTVEDDTGYSALNVSRWRKMKHCESLLRDATHPAVADEEEKDVFIDEDAAPRGFVRLEIANLPLRANFMTVGKLLRSFGMRPQSGGVSIWPRGKAAKARAFVAYDRSLVIKTRRASGFMLYGHRISVTIPKKTFSSSPDAHPGSRLFVSGFAVWSKSEQTVERLRKTFSAFGPLEEDPILATDKKGFAIAFVNFEDVEAAVAAREWLCGEFRLGGFLNVQFRLAEKARSDAGSVSSRSSRSSRSSFSAFSSASSVSSFSSGRKRNQARGRGRGMRQRRHRR